MLVLPWEVAAQFLWEASARVGIDFTPGPGTMIKSGLLMSVKCIAVCHNSAHMKVLKNIFLDYVYSDVKEAESKFAPSDMAERLANVKPVRLSQWESEKKRPAEALESPAAKRAALADSFESMLQAMEGSAGTPKAKVKAKAGGGVSVPAVKAKASSASGSDAPAPADANNEVAAATPKASNPKAAAVNAPADNLQALLKERA